MLVCIWLCQIGVIVSLSFTHAHIVPVCVCVCVCVRARVCKHSQVAIVLGLVIERFPLLLFP